VSLWHTVAPPGYGLEARHTEYTRLCSPVAHRATSATLAWPHQPVCGRISITDNLVPVPHQQGVDRVPATQLFRLHPATFQSRHSRLLLVRHLDTGTVPACDGTPSTVAGDGPCDHHRGPLCCPPFFLKDRALRWPGGGREL